MFLPLLLVSSRAIAGCDKDTDCKGDRICQGGECADPAPAAAAAEPGQRDTPSLVELCKGTMLVTETVIPGEYFKVVKQVKDVKGWYGSLSEMPPRLAKEARELGADAVVNVHTRVAPSAWSWASPKAEALFVRWTESARSAHLDVQVGCY